MRSNIFFGTVLVDTEPQYFIFYLSGSFDSTGIAWMSIFTQRFVTSPLALTTGLQSHHSINELQLIPFNELFPLIEFSYRKNSGIAEVLARHRCCYIQGIPIPLIARSSLFSS